MKAIVVYLWLLAAIVAPRALQAQEKVLYGTLTKIERDERYEQRCGFLCHVLGGDAARAYHATVTDTTGRNEQFWFFALDGNKIPAVGQSGHWVLHRITLWRVWQQSPYGTPYDIDWALQSDDDVQP